LAWSSLNDDPNTPLDVSRPGFGFADGHARGDSVVPSHGGVEDSSKVAALKDETLALPEPERQELAREVLPTLLLTPAGLAEIDGALACLSDDELNVLVERVAGGLQTSARKASPTVIAEALRTGRAQSRP
jgi:hypothetical protein